LGLKGFVVVVVVVVVVADASMHKFAVAEHANET